MSGMIILLILVAVAVLVIIYRYPDFEFSRISDFLKRHPFFKKGLLIFVAFWAFGTFVVPRLQNDEKYPKAMIAYQKDGPVLEFEIPEGVAPEIEILDSIVARTGKEKTYVGVVYKFDGVLRTSLVGGKVFTKYFGWLMPKKSKWHTSYGTKKIRIIEASRLKFNGPPPYIIEVLAQGKTVLFENNPIHYRVIE